MEFLIHVEHPDRLSSVATAKWKLADFMEANNVKVKDVGLALGSYTRIPMVYRLANQENPPKRVDLDTLGELVRVLRELTGKPVSFDDLLEFDPTDN